MIHDKYNNMQPVEKVIFTGQLLHAAMNDEELFEMAEKIITLGKLKGIFNDVEIMPERRKEDDLFATLGEVLNPHV